MNSYLTEFDTILKIKSFHGFRKKFSDQKERIELMLKRDLWHEENQLKKWRLRLNDIHKSRTGELEKFEKTIRKEINRRKRTLQRAISDASWDKIRMQKIYLSMAMETLGHQDGILVVDEMRFLKKGDDSAGVGDQNTKYDKNRSNCQVGIFVNYISKYGHIVVSNRLFLPEHWFGSDYKEKRKKCCVPVETKFQTKSQILLEMLQTLNECNIPYRFIVSNNPELISSEVIDYCIKLPDKLFLLETSPHTPCWRPDSSIEKVWPPEDSTYPPTSAIIYGQEIKRIFWQQGKLFQTQRQKQGHKEPFEFAKTNLFFEIKCKLNKLVLFISRMISEESRSRYYLSNAAANIRISDLAWLSNMEQIAFQTFHDIEKTVNLSRYSFRKFSGWHHHMLACTLAHYFLWHLQIMSGINGSNIDVLD